MITRAKAPHVLAAWSGCTCLLALLAAAPAQGQADLAGTWRIDLERSDARGAQAARPLADTRLTVSIADGTVRAERSYAPGSPSERRWQAVYEPDGKPHEITGPFGDPQKVRARWRKDKLQLSYTLSRQTPRGAFDLDVTETWALSKAGDLVIQYSTRIGDRNRTRKEIYVREGDDG